MAEGAGDPVLHLPHAVLANMMVVLCLHALPDASDAVHVDVLRDEVLPAAKRGASPLGDLLIAAAEGLVSAHGRRGAKGEASLVWALKRGQAEAALDQYFRLRSAQGIERLRQTQGGDNAA